MQDGGWRHTGQGGGTTTPPGSPYRGGGGGHSPLGAAPPGPELPAMAIADVIFEELRASGSDTRAAERACERTAPNHQHKNPIFLLKLCACSQCTGVPGHTAPEDQHPIVVQGMRAHSSFERAEPPSPPLRAVTDRHLELLAFVFKESHLQNALELVQVRPTTRLSAHCVTVRPRVLLTCTICLRACCLGLPTHCTHPPTPPTPPPPPAPAQTGRVKRLTAERSGRTLFQVHGKSAKEEYLVFPSHYCSAGAYTRPLFGST
jgi:hypothetical protein